MRYRRRAGYGRRRRSGRRRYGKRTRGLRIGYRM